MKIENSTIAVIGGTGFLGRLIVESLAARGARLKVLARNPDRAKSLKPMGQVGQIALHGGNALDDASLIEVMQGTDAVINTIGILAESRRQIFGRRQASGHQSSDHQTSGRQSSDHQTSGHQSSDHQTSGRQSSDHQSSDPQSFAHQSSDRRQTSSDHQTSGPQTSARRQTFDSLQAELPGRMAAHAARLNIRRVVHISAIGANPQSHIKYAASKGRGEAALFNGFAEATILRPSLIFGAGDAFFNRFARMAVLAPGLPVIGGGHNKVQPVFVGDVAESVAACLADDATCGKVYELGGPEIMTFREVMAYIIRHIGRRRMLIPVPYKVMMMFAALAAPLPHAPITPDQLKQLKHDNIVSPDALGLADLGIKPKPIGLIVPGYLERYRPSGRFSVR